MEFSRGFDSQSVRPSAKHLLAMCIGGIVAMLPLSVSAGTQIFTTPGTYTFTVPTGVTSINVVAVGGGGGGGGNAAGWGSGAGGGCGGGVAGSSLAVLPGAQYTVIVGAGGLGGQGAGNGSVGSISKFGTSITATAGSWGRSGYYNLYGSYYGGSGGGSGGGGGGNGWPGFYGIPGDGGTAGSNTNSHGSGGDCTGGGWGGINLANLITAVSYSAGAGGNVPQSYNYYGGGGGGGLIIDGSTVSGQSVGTPGGAGYGGGGGGHCWTCGSSSNGGNGASGVVYVEWDGPAFCSITVSPSTVNQGTGATLSWTSTDADWFYITNIGYVSGSGSTSVTPSVTTAYNGSVDNAIGGGNCSDTLTVHPSCTVDGETVEHGDSTTAYFDSAPAYGGSCASQTRTCTDGTLSGSYAYASCTVADPLSCTLDGATLAHGESATFYSSDSVSSSVCSSYEATRTCSNGTLSGEDTYTYASCSCVAAYTCSGQTIQYTNTSCSTSNVTTCTTPNFCSTGAPACLNTPPTYSSQGSFTGHLEIRPAIVPTNGRSKVYWNLTYVESCSVTGDNGDSWTGASSGVSGQQTAAITQKTSYTLACTGLDGSTIEETQILNILPKFNER